MGTAIYGRRLVLSITYVIKCYAYRKEGMLMLTLEGLISVISLCLAAYGLGYSIGYNNAKK